MSSLFKNHSYAFVSIIMVSSMMMPLTWAQTPALAPPPASPIPRRPPLTPTAPVVSKQKDGASATPASAQAASTANCRAMIADIGITAETASKLTAPLEGCAVEDAVQLTMMTFRSRSVAFPDKPVLACKAAMTLGLWLRDLGLPLIEASLQVQVTAVQTGPGFECRNRNRAKIGKLSAHAQGLAVDIAGIKLANNTSFVVGKLEGPVQQRLLDALRKSACGWFTTVLGPGSDAYHSDHLHFDVESRGANGTTRFCQ